MNIANELKAINTALDDYRNRLDAITDSKFTLTPPKGGWSYAEVYSHIMQSTIGASIMLERCTHQTSKPVKGGLNWVGRYVLFTGLFPPVKTSLNEDLAAKMAPKKIDKEEARNLIIKCRKRLDDMAALIADKPSTRRSQHPRMGTLNSWQWFRFIRIHLQHHLKQLSRISKQL